ncbi:MAG: hypothetical protein K6E92_03740 [Lachnospiraceae bacterium]|nr:hypothetical protein [Lachnospiraceae bacterium]
MTGNEREWSRAKEMLTAEVVSLGFPAELGEEIARQLGSPKAMQRMLAYLRYTKPAKAEVIVDEMLAIRSEIEAWREKKDAEEANAKYNELLYFGLDTDDPED